MEFIYRGSLISAQALFSLRAFFGATRIHSYMIIQLNSKISPERSNTFLYRPSLSSIKKDS